MKKEIPMTITFLAEIWAKISVKSILSDHISVRIKVYCLASQMNQMTAGKRMKAIAVSKVNTAESRRDDLWSCEYNKV